MTNTENGNSQEFGHTSRNRYEGWRGTTRILWEALSETPALLKDDFKATTSKLRNEGDVDDEECGVAGCGKDGVTMHEHPNQWMDAIALCRRHWLGIVAVKTIAYVFIFGVLAVGLSLLLILVMAA